MEKNLKQSIKSVTRQGCPLFPLLFLILPDALAVAIRQENVIKGIQIGKEVKLSLFADDMISLIRNPQNNTRKLPEATNNFSDVAQYNINLGNPVSFLYTTTSILVKRSWTHRHLFIYLFP